MDSLDIFIRLAKRDDSSTHKALRLLFKRIYNADIPKSAEPYFTNTYLFCLHKDEKDPSKLRPIGIPTALRRIIANHIARVFRLKFGRRLWPHNFAVGVEDGMDLIIKSSQLEMEKYITNPQKRGDAPTRCLISIDLVNMFNEISRDELFKVIEAEYPELVPLISMLYDNPGTVFYKMADGKWYIVHMEDGVKPGLSTLMHLGSIGTGHNPTAAHGLPPQKGTQTLPTE
jgi:hypothetical protein